MTGIVTVSFSRMLALKFDSTISLVGTGYQLSWSVELKSKRVYAISDRNAYLSRYYPNNCNNTEEAAVVSLKGLATLKLSAEHFTFLNTQRLVFEPETEASK